MENITYNIEYKPPDISKILNTTNIEDDSFMNYMTIHQINYSENLTVPELKQIAEYYEISTRKLKKDEIIQDIILFEFNSANSIIIAERKRKWYFLKELKNYKYLKQYILF